MTMISNPYLSPLPLILKALLRRLGWLALVLWGFPVGILALVLVGIPWGIWRPAPLLEIGRGAILIALMLFPIVMWFVGLLLAQAMMSLLPAAQVVLLPSYRHRVVAVSTVLGFALWAAVLPSFALQDLVANRAAFLIPWATLGAYGALGLGFIGGICVTNAQNAASAGSGLWQRWMWVAAMLATMFLPISLNHAPLRQWMTAPWLGDWVVFTPLGVLCLLVGPLSWRGLTVLWTVRALPPPTYAGRDVQAQVHSGSGWGLATLVRSLHGQHSLRPEFLLFQPNLLSLPTLPWLYLVSLSPVVMVFPILLSDTLSFSDMLGAMEPVFVLFSAALPLMPILGGGLNAPRLGQSLLLPGVALNRSTMPRKILLHLLVVWLIGAGFAMLPVAIFAIWTGASAENVLLTAALLLWGICTACAFAFFRLPRKTVKAVGDPVELVVGMVLVGFMPAAQAWGLELFPAATCFAAIAMGFVIPMALTHFGQRRWQNMDYGA